MKVAVVGAGIFGCSVAIHISKAGGKVDLFDRIGVMRAASAINQNRVHSGYHYPRSKETIKEVFAAKESFEEEYRDAIVNGIQSYYAVPHSGSLTSASDYVRIMQSFNLPMKEVELPWVNFDYLDKLWAVEEKLYCPTLLRDLCLSKIQSLSINVRIEQFTPRLEEEYDYVIYATYGMDPQSARQFPIAKYQLAEKVKILLPHELQKVSLVVVDGPFTAFDPLGTTNYSLFGSAKYTNHWQTTEFPIDLPSKYARLLNSRDFLEFSETNFHKLREEASLVTPLASEARYCGSKFTIRVVEDNSKEDRRTAYMKRTGNLFYIFSGKVVSAVAVAKSVEQQIFGPARPFDGHAGKVEIH